MDSLYLAFCVVFPLFLLMAIGFGVRSFGVADEPFLRKINSFVFKVCLPCVMFLSIYNSDYSQDFSWKMILTALGIVTLNATLLFIIIPRIEPEGKKRGVMIQGIFRSNFVLFGIPVAEAIYSADALGVMAIAISVVVPIFNAVSVFALEYYSGKKSTAKGIAKSMLKNPVIVAAIVGFVFHGLGLQVPDLVLGVVDDLSDVATPLALLALGGTFHFARMGDALRQLVICTVGRLILVPLLGMSIAISLGFRNAELVAFFCMLSSPTAVTSYAMAQAAGADGQLAGQLVVTTSLCSVVTIFLWVTFMSHFGLI